MKVLKFGRMRLIFGTPLLGPRIGGESVLYHDNAYPQAPPFWRNHFFFLPGKLHLLVMIGVPEQVEILLLRQSVLGFL